ncbi:hypothetical protein C8R44DRAFT_870195 [Mycena epipterygia]|nr:hypothetical protein C8R44DRAFT_870195 [Mycena epipterygia]
MQAHVGCQIGLAADYLRLVATALFQKFQKHQHSLSIAIEELVKMAKYKNVDTGPQEPLSFVVLREDTEHIEEDYFTFLATLILLLFVSSSIVCRALFLRRRFRSHVDRAMALGLVLAPPEQGSQALSFGAQPKLFDVWLLTVFSRQPISAQPVSATDGEHFSHWGSTVSSKAPSTIHSDTPLPERLQVSVLVAMPAPPHATELPEVAFGFAHSLYQS